MPDLVSRESAEQKKMEGIKTLAPNQMLSRLSISLAQLKARNIFKKLKNEIRQIIYYLCSSKNLINSLIQSNLINQT